MGFRDDDSGAFQAFEAVLVAILVTTSILFVVATTNPVLETTGTGIDPNDTASDLMARIDTIHLETQVEELVHPDGSTTPELVQRLETLTAAQPELRYVLRLDNGFGALQLYPSLNAEFSTPRNAGTATSYVFPTWSASSDASTVFSPGTKHGLDLEGEGTLCFNGQGNGPGQVAWGDLWLEESSTHVPDWAPLGSWSFGPACSTINFDVRLPSGQHVERPVYALQLLLWDSAAT